jgi:hypothetical protein
MLKIVADTNVLVSGTLVAEGSSAKILRAVRDAKIILLTSRRLMNEYATVIQRPHIAKKYPRVKENAKDLINFLSANAELVEENSTLTGLVLADPKDDMVIACAIVGKADYIVSGDPHVLVLKQAQDIPILTPAEFVEKLRASTNKE